MHPVLQTLAVFAVVGVLVAACRVLSYIGDADSVLGDWED